MRVASVHRLGAVVIAVSGLLQGEPAANDHGLIVTAVLLNQEFCYGQPSGLSRESVNPETITLRYDASLSYRNAGSQSIIVPTFQNVTILLSTSLDDARHNRNKLVISPWVKRQPDDLAARGIDLEFPPSPYFEVIPKGTESRWHPVADVAIPVHDPGKLELLGKKVFIQLEVDHQTIPHSLIQKLRTNWSNQGILWAGKVRTPAIELKLPLSPNSVVCTSKVRID